MGRGLAFGLRVSELRQGMEIGGTAVFNFCEIHEKKEKGDRRPEFQTITHCDTTGWTPSSYQHSIRESIIKR